MTVENEQKLVEAKQKLLHAIAPCFEDAPCYPLEELLKIHGMYRKLADTKNVALM